MTTVLNKLVTEFRYKFNRKGLEEAEKGLQGFKKQTLESFASIVGVLSGGLFISKIAETTDKLGKMADSLGIPVKQLQSLQFAAERAGVPVSSLTSSMQNLSRAIGQAAHGQGAFWTDINARSIAVRKADGTMKSTLEVFNTLNQVFQHISKQKQFDIAAALGINPQTVPLLQQTSKSLHGVEMQAKQLGLVSKKDTIAAAKFEDAWTNIKMSLYALGVQIFTFTAPAFQLLASMFIKVTRFIRVNKYARFATHLAIIAGAAISLITVIRVLTRTLAVFGGVFDVVMSPITLIIGGLVLLGLVIQDVWGYFHGMKSVTGELVASFHKWPKPLQYVVVVIALVVDAFKWLWHEVVKITKDIGKGFEYLWGIVKKVGKAIGHFFSTLYHFVVPKWLQKLFSMMGKKLSMGVEFKHAGKNKGTKKTVKEGNIFSRELAKLDAASIKESKRSIYKKAPATGVAQKLQGITQHVQVMHKIPNVVASKPIATRVIHQKTVNVSLGSVNVSAKTDASPQAIAQHVNDAVAEKLKQSVGYFDSGVIR